MTILQTKRRHATAYALIGLLLFAVARRSQAEEEAAAPTEDLGAHYQSTYVYQKHGSFPAAYTGPRSLLPTPEGSYTFSATAYLGARLWSNGEFYFNPELISSRALSNLTGMAGLSNSENQKGGGADPKTYLARVFLRQTWGFVEEAESLESGPNQLAGVVDKHRLVLTVGKISLLDIFDINSLSRDPRTQFLNWASLTHGAFDYAADSRGYTAGASVEYIHDDWAFRFGRFAQPQDSNGFRLDSDIGQHYGEQIEIEHGHELYGQSGRVHTVFFRNRARMGGFSDALNFWRANGQVGVPDVANVRVDRTKKGFGLNIEQTLSDAVGVFAGTSWNDGKSETYAFTEIERSQIVGAQIKGKAWSRPNDTLGMTLIRNGLSSDHRSYLAAGGLGFFIGDGRINYSEETIFESYYSIHTSEHTRVSLDFQRLRNPGFNADRGPVNLLGIRLHFEY